MSSFPILAGTRPLIDNDDRRVEVDALGSILWDTFRADDDTTVIVREHSDGVIVDRFDVGVRLNDFVLETESVLLGAALGDGKLYRVNLDSGITDLIFESDLLSQTQKIAIDPAGRVLALTRPVTNGLQAGGQVVRLDLVTGDTEVIGLDDGIFNPSDMNLLVIPEPPSMLLALIASLLIAFRHVAKHRGFAR